MKKILGVFIGAILIIVCLWRVPMASALNQLFPAGGADITPLLAGVWDCRKNRTTIFHVNNPTHANWLWVQFQFYYDQEQPISSRWSLLSPNDVVEVDARFVAQPGLPTIGKWGKVKITSFWWYPGTPVPPAPPWNLENGIKGFQKEVFSSQISYFSASGAPIPGPFYPVLPVSSIYGLTEANLEEIPVVVSTTPQPIPPPLPVEDEIFNLKDFMDIAAQTTDHILYDVEADEIGELCKLYQGSRAIIDSLVSALAEQGITKMCTEGITQSNPRTSPLQIQCPTPTKSE
jgi:hypothetical protein